MKTFCDRLHENKVFCPGMEKKECYAPLKSFFVYLCVGLCLESIVHIRHILLSIQTEGTISAEKLQFRESCLSVYTST